MQTAFIFNHAGAPWLTQYWSRQVIEKVYSDLSPDSGYSGDEDQGLMGSLAVLMKLGLFAMDGGASTNPVYEIGSPIFDEVNIMLDPHFYADKEIQILIKNQGESNYYIQNGSWNGEVLNNCWIYHQDFIKGGELILEMGSEPNKEWGLKDPIPNMD